MKKILSLISFFILTVFCCFLGACSGDIPIDETSSTVSTPIESNDVEPTVYELWKLKYVNETGTTQTFDLGDEFEGKKLTKDLYVLILFENEFILRGYGYLDEDYEKESLLIMHGQFFQGYQSEYYLIPDISPEESFLIAKIDNDTITISDGYFDFYLIFKAV